MIREISVCHPVEVACEYLLYAVDYAKRKGYDHIQICGPIHDAKRSNIDGMTPYRKYAQFDGEKDMRYVEISPELVVMDT